jgi:2-succinyl-5-enolpyruvyl-6-hydroxy-3-cyclohexene-1-carboxylate synthase
VSSSPDATLLARSVLTRLVEHGVAEVVVAPGSRNAPLSFAAWDAAEAGLVRLHTRIDERSAGFLALGLSRTGRRAAVVCTSGTAAANLHPAVLEAAHSGVDLVVVTADRPARLRGTSANQTTDQVGIFGPLVETQDASAGEPRLSGPGPVHLNVPLDDPLVPPDRWVPDVRPPAARDRAGTGAWARREGLLPAGPRTVVVAGDDAGPPARVLAEAAGWPLLAEPSSGSRTGDHAIRTYRLLLASSLGDQVERVVVCGHPTLSRPVSRLLARPDVEVVDTPVAGVWAERPFPVDRRLDAVPVGVEDGSGGGDWLEAWRAADRSVGRQLDRLLADEAGLTPYAVAGAVARALPPGGLLVVGASSPIRDLDLMVPRYEVGARRKVVANRGLAGIDGTVSSAIGAALGRPASTRSLALMGDVTFLHDSNGLVLGPDEPRPDLVVVVVNDDGGSIFSMLEQGAERYAAQHDRLFGTPHGVDLASLCAATRTPHLRVTSLPELEQALATPNGGIEVVEAVVRRDNRRALDARIRALRP